MFVMVELELAHWRSSAPHYAVVDVVQSRKGLLSFLSSSFSEKSDKNFMSARNLMFVLPGNPCSVRCYHQFAGKLRGSCDCDVLVLGYPGHNSSALNDSRLFDLQNQIDICVSFFSTIFCKPSKRDADDFVRLPKPCDEKRAVDCYEGRVFLAGHSIGAYIGLHILSRFKSSIKLFFGLAPVLTRINESPKGRMLAFMRIPLINRAVAKLISVLFCFPRPIVKYLAFLYTKRLESDLRNDLISTVCGTQVRNVFYLLGDELRTVKTPDWTLLQSVQEKMVLYYVPDDHWAPVSHGEEIRRMCTKLHGYIVEDAASKVPHSWCLSANDVVILHSIFPHLL